MSTWNDPLLDLPLDIRVVSEHIAHAWRMATREQELKARRDYENFRLSGMEHEARFEFTQDYQQAQQLHDSIIEILTAYDEGRTRHIKFLKERLMELHNLTPRPIFIEKGALGE